MGVNLSLLPFDIGASIHISRTVLECLGRKELFEEIEKLPAIKVPEDFKCYLARGANGGSCYGVVTETVFGEPLTCTTALHLAELQRHYGVTDNYVNRAIWAYLKELPPHLAVALYWD